YKPADGEPASQTPPGRGGLPSFHRDCARGQAYPKGGGTGASPVPPGPHALFDHQRLEGGGRPGGGDRPCQYHGRAERAVCCARARSIFRAVSKDTTTPEEPDQHGEPTGKSD